MADVRIALKELLRTHKDDTETDVLTEGLILLVQELMEAEVKEKTGAGRYERTSSRRTYRNGYRPRRRDTRVGTVTLRVPKLRRGSYFPSLLQPRRRAEKVLLSVVQEAHVHPREHAEGGRPCAGPGDRGDFPERGIQDL